MKVLLAETNGLLHHSLVKLLQKSGHKVQEASNEVEILDQLQKVSPPQLAIIDWSIVRLNDSIISQIHTLNSPSSRHIIVLTTDDQKAEMLTVLQSGTDDYLVKPFTPEEFQIRTALVNRLVEMKMQLDSKNAGQNQIKTDLQNFDDALKILPDASFEAIFLSERGICLNQNQTAQRMFGYTREEAIGRPGTDWIVPTDREMVKNKMLEGDMLPYETTGLRKDGSTFPAEIHGRMAKYSGGHVRVTAMRDITDRKKAEEQLIASEKKFRDIIENVSEIAIQGYDEKRKVTFWNLASEKLYGYSAKEALGGKLEDLIIPEKMRRNVLGLHRRWVDFGEQIPPGKLDLISKNGSIVPVYSSHYMLESSSGKEMFCFDTDLRPLINAENERRQLETQLHKKQKSEALGVMAGGIAHDFNNILAIILSNIELIELTLTTNILVQEQFQYIKGAISRASETVKQILSFSAPEENFERVNIAQIVNESLRLLRASIPSTVDILKMVDNECRDLTIYVSPGQIQQVLVNLCNNAVYSMGGQGLLEVSLKQVNVEVKDLQTYDDIPPGNYLNLTVKDSGAGMSKDLLTRIFDPFFTTKPVNEGSGMGLSIVDGIIKNHAGSITVDSVVGQGSTFQIYLPISEEIEIESEKTPSERSLRGNESILFVDDEEQLAHAAERMLTLKGFVVTAETSSAKALSLFQANPEGFDLVITDQTMPELSGIELIAEMQKIKPNLLTILCTGYSAKVFKTEAEQLGIQEFCLKPLSLSQLVQTVRKVLDGAKEQHIP